VLIFELGKPFIFSNFLKIEEAIYKITVKVIEIIV
jgi:hypothetical protein